jgi:hypothetical protein
VVKLCQGKYFEEVLSKKRKITMWGYLMVGNFPWKLSRKLMAKE